MFSFSQGGATGPKVRAALLALLTDGGLTAAEADGLIDAWEGQFLATPGRRLLLRLEPADYERFCPIKVTPTPAVMERVGLILYECPE